MSNSSYYIKLYRQKKNEVNAYEHNLNELRTILNNVADNLYDDVRAVNNKVDDLIEDLSNSIRHNVMFTNRVNALENIKEKGASADENLKIVINELEEEEQKLSNLLNQAVSDRDYYHSQYLIKEKEEQETFWAKIL